MRHDIKADLSLTVLIVTNEVDFAKKVRNIEGVSLVSPEKLNAKHIAKSRFVYVDNDSIDIIEKRLTNGK